MIMQADELKKDFPFFYNKEIIYLDSAATSQKPQKVLDSMDDYYKNYCANIHRGSHEVGNLATTRYEESREFIANYIGADFRELVFTRGTTESINMLAECFVKDRFKTVILSHLEHHSNIVPWQLHGMNIEVIDMDKDLNIDLNSLEDLLKKNPNSLVSLTHVSNSFGIINPIKTIIELVHKYGSKVLIDGAQAIAHFKIDVKELNVDFYVFSAHKAYGPTGVGVLYGKFEYLCEMKPYHGGGSMIDDVSFEKSSFLKPPHKLEAGTQAIAEVIGFAEALRYLSDIKNIDENDSFLMELTKKELGKIPNIIFYTKATNVSANISFNIKDIHHDDIGILLSKQNIMLRTGHHCAMPIMKKLAIEGTVRISFGIYTTKEDILTCIIALKKAIKLLL